MFLVLVGFVIFCVICSKERLAYGQAHGACQICVVQALSLTFLNEVKVNGNRVYAGFCYQSVIRSVILRAKVENNVLALTLLVGLLRDVLREPCHDYNSPECLVVAVPSSLRSRLYGRFNIAEALRRTIFPRAKFLTCPLPGSFWRLKRAGRNMKPLGGSGTVFGESISNVIKYYIKFGAGLKKANDIGRQISSSPRILVVDDVLTTGFTMGTLFDQLKMLGAQRIEGLVAASHSSQIADRGNHCKG
jgi:predicted amidophosphoribosyltransferase